MHKNIVLFFIIISTAYKLNAVPAYPFPINITQPDGTILTIQLHGDQSNKIRTTLDEYVISMDKNGFYTYNIKDKTQSVAQENIVARNIEDRSESDHFYLKDAIKLDDLLTKQVKSKPLKTKKTPQKSKTNKFPTTGSPRSIVILVNFKDKKFVTLDPLNAFTRLLNQENYNDNGGTGSARDYFRSASYGVFNPQFDVVGPYTLPKNMSYYGENDEDNLDKNPVQMIIDACTLAYKDGIDFSIYDTNGDGYIDNVFVYYAGHNEAEGADESTIWPHRWVVVPGHNYDGKISSITFNGVKLFDYACSSELKGNRGNNMCGIGTFCHEFGHVLGLPDYYHTSSLNKETLKEWSIMDEGTYLNQGRTPPTYSAFDRFFLGWLTPEELNTSAEKELEPLSQSMHPNQNTKKQAYLLAKTTHNLNGNNPSPQEFFIMEYRKQTMWDTFLPAEGLLFWHIDYNESAWNENTVNNYNSTLQTEKSHMRVYLETPNKNNTTPGTAFTSGSFTPKTWSGDDINRKISNITKSPDKINFYIEVLNLNDLNNPKIIANAIQDSIQFSLTKVNEQNVKYLKLSSMNLTEDLSLSLDGEHANLFTLSDNTIKMENAANENGSKIYIIFQAVKTGIFNATLTISGGGMIAKRRIQLEATAIE